jgi:predicted NUDIX family NTP pyrophosphohydrolase
MPRVSAGLLLHRSRNGRLEVLLVHPGGPFWTKRDLGAWSIPKGEAQPGEDLLERARTEFEEETGARPDGPFVPLRPIRQAGGKHVHAWAVSGDLDPTTITSNTFEMEFPPGSGHARAFPEIDRAAWFDLAAAREKIVTGQRQLLDELATTCPAATEGSIGSVPK